MLKKLKNIIIELAKSAVLQAENVLGSGNGKQKKDMAINYIIEHLPFSNLTKKIIVIFLSHFIDDAIEISVLYLKSLPDKKGEI